MPENAKQCIAIFFQILSYFVKHTIRILWLTVQCRFSFLSHKTVWGKSNSNNSDENGNQVQSLLVTGAPYPISKLFSLVTRISPASCYTAITSFVACAWYAPCNWRTALRHLIWYGLATALRQVTLRILFMVFVSLLSRCTVPHSSEKADKNVLITSPIKASLGHVTQQLYACDFRKEIAQHPVDV